MQEQNITGLKFSIPSVTNHEANSMKMVTEAANFLKGQADNLKEGQSVRHLKLTFLVATTAVVTKKLLEKNGPRIVHQLDINAKDLEIKKLKINKAIRELEKAQGTVDDLIGEGFPFETRFH